MKTLIQFLQDDRGSSTVSGVLLMYTILAFGTVVGLVTLRDQVVQEYGDTSVALESLDQSYRVNASGGVPGCQYLDTNPLEDKDPPGDPPATLQFTDPAAEGS